MEEFIELLRSEFTRNAEPEIALGQRAYMRNQFDFYGIKAPLRRQLQQPFLTKEHLPAKKEAKKIVKALWQKPQRDLQLFAQELIYKYHKEFEEKDIELFEYIITHKSWWDSVDFIAVNILGKYFERFPELQEKYVDKWLSSGNIWLQRSAILFQLKYKNKVDTKLLSKSIHRLLGSKEFFINKAIGWMLRQYSRTNPAWVQTFCDTTNLHSLSKREALRLIQ